MRETSFHRDFGASVGAGAEAASFFASIMSGFLLGWLADHWLGTAPAFVVLGIMAGSGVGFWRMWLIATRDDDGER